MIVAKQTRSASLTMAALSTTGIGALFSPANTTFLLCDVQTVWNRKNEDGSTLIHEIDSVINTSRYLCALAKLLKIRLVVSEQYPERFGATDPRITEAWGELRAVYAKTRFSMAPFPSSTGVDLG